MCDIRIDFPLCKNSTVDVVLKECVREASRVLLDKAGSENLEALVLTGTLARGEASALIREDGTLFSWSDIEMLAVYRHGKMAGAGAGPLSQAAEELETSFRRRGFTIPIDFCPNLRKHFRRLRARIFTIELGTHGKVLWGDPSILDCVPFFPPEKLSRWDAISMLFNRMIEHLDMRRTISTASHDELIQIQYWNNKIVLDSATSLLAFNGWFKPSYAERGDVFAESFEKLDDLSDRLPDLPDQVRRLTDSKLDPSDEGLWGAKVPEDPASEVRRQWSESARILREVWLWQSNRFLGGKAADDVFAVVSKYLKNDMIGIKVKSWIQLLLGREGRRRVSPWRALSLLSLARPNVLIYVAGAMMYFAMSEVKTRERAEKLEHAADAANRFLPVPSEEWEEPREVLGAVIDNWKWFVK